MSQIEFNTCPKCPKCRIRKLKPTGKAGSSRDPKTNKETGFDRDYKRDNCGYPEGGHAKVSQRRTMAADLSLFIFNVVYFGRRDLVPVRRFKKEKEKSLL
jgi:hypothetical protein